MEDQQTPGAISATGKRRLPDVMPVRFTEGTFERIDALVGENKRAGFVRKAVERALKVEARQRAKSATAA